MKTSAIIIPVHNRRATTLACLRNLAADAVMDWATVIVMDDGSSDGTAEAIRAEFPEVAIRRGDGSWWWTGAIAEGMRWAMAEGAEYLLWLNDDTLPHLGACRRLDQSARETRSIVTGQCYHAPNGLLTYGGLVRTGLSLRLVAAVGDAMRVVDAACGNFVAIPRHVVEDIGLPDATRFPHAHGDTDFTLRARRAGHTIWIDPRATAIARPNALANYTSWLLSDVSLADIWHPLVQRRSYAYAPAHARFLTRHFGWRGAIYWGWTVAKRVPISLLRLATPVSWRRRIWGHRSRVWQEERALHEALSDTPSAETCLRPPSAHAPTPPPKHRH